MIIQQGSGIQNSPAYWQTSGKDGGYAPEELFSIGGEVKIPCKAVNGAEKDSNDGCDYVGNVNLDKGGFSSRKPRDSWRIVRPLKA